VKRLVVIAAGAVLATGAAGCASPLASHREQHQPSSQSGTVIGFAQRCGPAGLVTHSLTVTAARGGNVVATRTVRYDRQRHGPGHYRIVLAPGRYLISAPLSGHPAYSVAVRSGRTVTANFAPLCS
jgi:hypothetical protein